MIPVNKDMEALDYGAGTGQLSFFLSEVFSKITLMDNSLEMVQVMQEKVRKRGKKNLKPLFWDLVHSEYRINKFDCIFSEMVLHHISNTEDILKKWQKMLNPDGYLAIADLISEDGSFHLSETNVHLGFNPEDLVFMLKLLGFRNIEHRICYNIKRPDGRNYPVFLLVAKK